MSGFAPSLEELIRHRFSSVEHEPPRDVLASPRDRKFEERLLTEGLLIGKKWDELSDKDIEGVAKNEGLAHLSCESFVYYLPAFLLWSLRDSCWRGNLVDSLVSEMIAAAKGLPLYGVCQTNCVTSHLTTRPAARALHRT